MNNVFSIDVEDWYQGIGVPLSTWPKYEKRLSLGMDLLLELMDEFNVKSTCFILGKTAEDHPEIIKKIANKGHELASHGFSHELVYNLTPSDFRIDLKKSIDIIQNISGNKVIGYRAPYFSITNKSKWALDILVEEGIQYDSSIHPVINWRYGIPSANRLAHIILTNNGGSILEIPVTTFPYKLANLPVGGGAYLRIYPYSFIKKKLDNILLNEGFINCYIHPWELDPYHPKINLPLRVSLTHYFNLKSTYSKLRSMFSDFSFVSYKESFKL